MTKLGKPKRTRNRVPISCENCRKRKLKCNRKHPCSNCIKSHKIFLCKYAPAAGIVSTSKVQLTTEILRLKAKVNQLEHILKLNNIVFKQCDDKSLIQFDYRNGNYGICSDQVKSKQDPLVCLTDKFDQLIIQDNKLLHSGTTTYTALIGADKRLTMLSHNYMHNQKNWYKDYKLTLKKRPIDYPEDCIRTSNEYSYNLDLINKINAILPTLQCVNTLIDNFFKQVYPLFPFVDEDTFRKDMDCIILPLPNGSCKIALIHIHNIATVSLLLLFLRFAYVSLKKSPYDSLKSVEVGPEYIEYSRKLIFSLPTQDSIFKRIDLRNVQVLLYLRIYQGYGPDVTEESFENSISLATIVQMVRIAGGDRDPDNYSMKFRSKGQDRIFRYVFYELLYLDAFAAFDYGCPLLIHKNEYDVKLPMLDEDDQQLYDCLEGGKDISDVPLVKMRSVVIEKIECMTTSWESEAIKLVSQGLKSFQNVKQGSKKSSLEEIVFKIDDFIKRLPTISVLIGNTGTDDDRKIFSYAKVYKIPLSRLYNLRLKMLSVANTFWYLLFLNENETADAQIAYEFGKGLYVVKATEAALLLFKNAYDYLMYYTNGNNKKLEKEKDMVYEIFSLGLEPFLINRTLTLVQRSLLWLFSFLLSNIESNGQKYSFKDILRLFSVSVRKFVVSDWFNVNCSSKQCLLNIFHYLKKFYFLCVSIKDQYIIARHTASRINVFFNFLKESNRDGFNKYVDTKMMFPSNEIKGIPDMDDALSSETASSKSLTKNPELQIQDIINGRSNVLDDTDTDPFIAGIELLWPKADTNSTVDEIDEREDEGEEQNYYDIPKMDKYWPMQKPMRLGNEQVNLTDILEELKRETTFDPG